MTRKLAAHAETFEIAGGFTISRGTKTEAHVVVVGIEDGPVTGRGECVPYARYGESVESVLTQIEKAGEAGADGLSRRALLTAMPAGAARNAIDCALWDLEAKISGRRAYEIAGLASPEPRTTAFTLSLGTPDDMGAAAHAARHRALLKIKLGGDGDQARVRAVRENAPNSALIIDANEGWTPENFIQNATACADLGVSLIEQPLPAGDDDLLADVRHPVPICADESAHDSSDLHKLVGKYDAINIKLDKTGGLTEALRLVDAAQDAGLTIMVGCMLGSSLGMAPAMLVAQRAAFTDLDGPLLLSQDRSPGLVYQDSLVYPPAPELWG